MGLLNKYLRPRVGLANELDVQGAAANIKKNISFTGTNLYILAFAIIIASVGLNVNSIPVIIGAMLISPLMGPIIGVGLSLGTNNLRLLRFSLRNLGVMVLISIAASTLYFLLTPLKLENPTELLARTNPTIYDVLIAFFGGFAGIVETSRKERGTVLSGVAIATALMPPLCTIGFGLSQLNMHYALGALYLFFINSVFISLATFIGVKFLGFENAVYTNEAQRKRITRTVTVGIIIIIIPSVISAINIVRQNNFERNVASFVRNMNRVENNLIYDYRVSHEGNPSVVELFITNDNLSENEMYTVYALAEEQGIKRSQIVMNASTFGGGRNNRMMSELYQRTESIFHTKDSIIDTLRNELQFYHNAERDYAQLANEIRTQYPSIHDVTIAKGMRMNEVDTTAQKSEILVLVNDSGKLTSNQKSQMEQWLCVRLKTKEVKVISE